jgi:sugar/nucleoside kinase (ribokinase family)
MAEVYGGSTRILGCSTVHVCTFGDLLLDVIVRLERPLAPGGDAPAQTRVGAGGQAANVAAWVAALGGRARFVGKRGDDDAGALAAGRLSDHGVEVCGPVGVGSTGVVVALVELGGERTMAADRGVAPELTPDELDDAWFAELDWLHVSGYALTATPIADAAAAATKAARASRARVSVDLASWSALRDAGSGIVRERLDSLAPDLVFGTAHELELVGDGGASVRVTKLGRSGCLVERDGQRIELPAEPADVADTTGAGDAFAAGFLLGDSIDDSARRGIAAAARAVSRLGAMP